MVVPSSSATSVDPSVEELACSLPLRYRPSVLSRRRCAAAEFIAWSDQRDHQRRLQVSRQAQLAVHRDLLDQRYAMAQQLAWARKHAQLKTLHASAMAQLRHR
ncbi:MAG: hypothetical protein AB8B36_10505 [Prochlorococcus sp.]